MLPNGDLAPWLRYEDRELPQSGMLTVQEQVVESTGDPNAAGWRSDQWQVNCALVPADQAEKALGADFDSWHCFPSGWDENGSFDFAGHRCRPFYMEAFVFQRRHPLHRNTVVELCHDFVWYHMLDRPSPQVYFHPGENVEVARIGFPDHPDAWATVTVHLDFLRDFLATCHRALLLWFVVDRFATFDNVGQIALAAHARQCSAPGEFRQIDVVEVPDFGGYWRVRSILWRNYLVPPYPEPKRERNPWFIPPDDPRRTSSEFYLNDEGRKGSLSDRGCPAYVHFRREVLRRYLETDGFSVYFHMRTWGFAVNRRGNSVDVGINDDEQVTAFARDIAKLPDEEQAYWAAHSCFPSGGVCHELFQTRMQLDPPHSPNVLELADEARQAVERAVQPFVDVPLYRDSTLSRRDQCALTVGPLGDDVGETARLSKLLYQLCLESLDVGGLRRAVAKCTSPEQKNVNQWGSIRCLQELAIQHGKLAQDEAERIVASLRDLNSIRQVDAHPGSLPGHDLRRMYGIQSATSILPVWRAIVDSTVGAMRELACVIENTS